MTPRSPATAETMRQLRVALKLAMRHVTLRQAAARAECSENTLSRILRGENVSVMTVARIAEGLGSRLDIRLVDWPNGCIPQESVEKHNI